MKIGRYVFTHWGEIAYFPDEEIKDNLLSGVYPNAIPVAMANAYQGIRITWSKVLYESPIWDWCLEFALKYVDEHPNQLDDFIEFLGGKKGFTKNKKEYYELLLKQRMLEWVFYRQYK